MRSHAPSTRPRGAVAPALRDLLNALPLARPATVPAERLVEAYFQLRASGHEEDADDVLAHLVTEPNGYVAVVRRLAWEWRNSGHAGFDENDLVQKTLLLMIEGLRNGQRSALNWVPFCGGRFRDAKAAPEFNGYRGGRAKIEGQIQRAGAEQAAVTDDSLNEGEPVGDVEQAAKRPRRLEAELREVFKLFGMREESEAAADEVADGDQEAWGSRVVDRFIGEIADPDVAFVAREMFCDDPPPLTGGPDDVGRPSVAAAKGWKAYQAKYRLQKARAYMAEQLLHLLGGPTLGAACEAERAWLRTWFNKHAPPRQRPAAPDDGRSEPRNGSD